MVFIVLSVFFFLMIYISATTLTYSEKNPSTGIDRFAGISIIIPFYNEAPRLFGLMQSLFRQDYEGPFEIILVNDGSDDDYIDPIGLFLKSSPHSVKLIHNKFDKQKNLTSKQQALDMGVASAAYNYLVFSDADMEFDVAWLSSLAKMIPKGYDLVFGHTSIKKSGKSILEFFQAYQLEFLFAAAYAFHTAKISGSCMGNNLLLRKDSYLAVGQQTGIGYSIVEDRALFIKFKRSGMKVAPAFPFHALAKTLPCKSIGNFYSQALRWARGGFSESYNLLPIALIFSIQGVFLLLALCGRTDDAISAISFVNFGATIFFISCVFKKMKSKENAYLFPFYYTFLLIEIMVFLCSFVVTPVISWKNNQL
jgi:cellulose synthase/poly-beta-1,6-N-acetylglucosamine synthase-like glycosyltransferase